MEDAFQHKVRKPRMAAFVSCHVIHIWVKGPQGSCRASSPIRRVMGELRHCSKYLEIETIIRIGILLHVKLHRSVFFKEGGNFVWNTVTRQTHFLFLNQTLLTPTIMVQAPPPPHPCHLCWFYTSTVATLNTDFVFFFFNLILLRTLWVLQCSYLKKIMCLDIAFCPYSLFLLLEWRCMLEHVPLSFLPTNFPLLFSISSSFCAVSKVISAHLSFNSLIPPAVPSKLLTAIWVAFLNFDFHIFKTFLFVPLN